MNLGDILRSMSKEREQPRVTGFMVTQPEPSWYRLYSIAQITPGSYHAYNLVLESNDEDIIFEKAYELAAAYGCPGKVQDCTEDGFKW